MENGNIKYREAPMGDATKPKIYRYKSLRNNTLHLEVDSLYLLMETMMKNNETTEEEKEIFHLQLLTI